MNQTLKVNELFHSIQGESTWAGLPCLFIRLTGCHLRCGYCDTEYAFHEGDKMSIQKIMAELLKLSPACKLAEVTGGEPLLQPNVHPLMTRLCDAGYTVLLETSGGCDIAPCDPRVIRIMDLKTPGSGESDKNIWANLDHLNRRDEVKLVLTSRADFDWAREMILKHRLDERVNAVLLGAVHDMPRGSELPGSAGLHLRQLAEWVLADLELAGRVRIQAQLHKVIWDPRTRGV